MKIMLLGISIILVGIAFVCAATGGASGLGITIACLGFVVTIVGLFKNDQ